MKLEEVLPYLREGHIIFVEEPFEAGNLLHTYYYKLFPVKKFFRNMQGVVFECEIINDEIQHVIKSIDHYQARRLYNRVLIDNKAFMLGYYNTTSYLMPDPTEEYKINKNELKFTYEDFYPCLDFNLKFKLFLFNTWYVLDKEAFKDDEI